LTEGKPEAPSYFKPEKVYYVSTLAALYGLSNTPELPLTLDEYKDAVDDACDWLNYINFLKGHLDLHPPTHLYGGQYNSMDEESSRVRRREILEQMNEQLRQYSCLDPLVRTVIERGVQQSCREILGHANQRIFQMVQNLKSSMEVILSSIRVEMVHPDSAKFISEYEKLKKNLMEQRR